MSVKEAVARLENDISVEAEGALLLRFCRKNRVLLCNAMVDQERTLQKMTSQRVHVITHVADRKGGAS